MRGVRRENMSKFFQLGICRKRKERCRVVAQCGLPVSRDSFRGWRRKGAGDRREDRIGNCGGPGYFMNRPLIATWLQSGEGVARAHDRALLSIRVEIDLAAAGATSGREQALAGEVKAHVSAHLANRRCAVRRQVTEWNLPFGPGFGRAKAENRSGGERWTDAMAGQNQREAKLVLTMVPGCDGLRRDQCGREQQKSKY